MNRFDIWFNTHITIAPIKTPIGHRDRGCLYSAYLGKQEATVFHSMREAEEAVAKWLATLPAPSPPSPSPSLEQ